MSERDDDLIDVFLADLGSAPVPPRLAQDVSRRLHDEQPARLRRLGGRHAPSVLQAFGTVAAAVVLIAIIGTVVSGPTAMTASGSPPPSSTSQSGDRTVDLAAGGGPPVPVVIRDPAGVLTGATVVAASGNVTLTPAIVRGGDAHQVVVRFGWSSCYVGASLTISPDRTWINLEPTYRGEPCAGSVGPAAIALTFRDAVDVAQVALVDGSPPPAVSPTARTQWMPPPGVEQPTPTPQPTGTPPPASLTRTDAWQLTVAGSGTRQVVGLVRDDSGLLAGVAVVSETPSQPVRQAGVSTGSRQNSVIVRAPIEACTQWVSFVITAGAINLYPTKSPGACITPAGSVAVELDFASAVDPSTMAATLHPYQFYTAVQQLSVGAVAEGPQQQLFLGGQDSGATVATSTDDGATWGLQHLGDGRVSAFGADGDGALWVAVNCDPTQWDHCGRGLYRATPGPLGLADAQRVLPIDPVAMAVNGQAIVALDQPDVPDPASLAWPPRRLWLSEDGGQTWTTPTLPCDAKTSYATSVSFDLARRLVVLCEEGDKTGSAPGRAVKHLFRSSDDPPTGAWTVLPDPPSAGASMTLALTAGGAGWLFGYGSPLLVTHDSGASWSPEPGVADGTTRWVTAGEPWPSGGGLSMVADQSGQGWKLLRSVDGTTWTELAAFPDPPCCGG